LWRFAPKNRLDKYQQGLNESSQKAKQCQCNFTEVQSSDLLDANVFIQAKNLHYGLDFCPAFWDWILANNRTGRVFSIDKVADEINVGEDELTEWMQNNANGLFLKTDRTTADQFGRVSSWVMNQDYEPAAISTFLQIADYYLIAHALAGNHVVVTHEVPANSVKRIKIPNVCIGLELRFMTPYEMLRREKAKFILETKS
jgi:hypothetical protein